MTTTAIFDQHGDSLCAVCEKPAAYACHICGNASYCGEAHQTMNWTQHEKECNVVHTYNADTMILQPYDLIDDKGVAASIASWVCYTSDDGSQHPRVVETAIGDLSLEYAQSNIGGQAPRGTPDLRKAGMKRSTGRTRFGTRSLKPRLDSAGLGRAPDSRELGIDGSASVRVQMYRYDKYSDWEQRYAAAQTWDLTVPLKDHVIYAGPDVSMQIKNIAASRDKEEKPGLAVWFSIREFNDGNLTAIPSTGGYLRARITRSWKQTDPIDVDFKYGNLRSLRSSRAGTLTSWFRKYASGATASAQLKAKGLDSSTDYVLIAEDSRHERRNGFKYELTVRTDDTKFMTPVDLVVFIPDASSTDRRYPAVDSEMYPIQIPLSCSVRSQEQVDGLVCALKEHTALLADAEIDLMLALAGEPDDQEALGLMDDLETHQRRIGAWLNILEPHSVLLQDKGPDAFVGEALYYGAVRDEVDFTHVSDAINSALNYLLIEAKEKGFFASLKRKATKFGQGVKKRVQTASRKYKERRAVKRQETAADVERYVKDKIGNANMPGAPESARKWIEDPTYSAKLMLMVQQWRRSHKDISPEEDEALDRAENMISKSQHGNALDADAD